MKLLTISIFFLLFNVFTVIAQKNIVQSNLVELSDWKVYDKSQGVNVPYMFSYHSEYKSVFQEIDLSTYSNFKLQIIGITKGSIFLGERLIYTDLNAKDTLQLSINELIEIDAEAKLSRLTFYSSKNENWNPPRLSIISNKNIDGEILVIENRLNLLYKNTRHALTSSNTILYTLYLWVFFAIYAYYINANFSLTNIFLPWLIWLRFKSKEEETSVFEIFIFIILYSIILEFFLSNRNISVEETTYYHTFFLGITQKNAHLYSHLSLGFFIFIWMLFRLLAIRLMGSLYQIRQLFTLYIKEWHRFSLGYVFILLLITSIFYFAGWQIGFGLQLLFWISLLFKAFLISTFINRTFKLKKVYLFSYFCIGELIPILLGMKFFIDF